MVVQSPNKPGSTTKYINSTAASSTAVSASDTSSPFKKGKEYQLLCELYVRKGPAKTYAIKNFSDLSADAKKYSTSSKLACLNKGTVVSCTDVDGCWIKTPSGWICGKQGSENYITEYTGTAAQKKAYQNAVTNMKAASTATTTSTTTAAKKTAATTKITFKKGKQYKLLVDLNVRKGPGTNYAIKKRSQLTADGKKHACKGTNAVLKKGTVVTCLKVSGNWMKIPSGWICCKQGYVGNK